MFLVSQNIYTLLAKWRNSPDWPYSQRLRLDGDGSSKAWC